MAAVHRTFNSHESPRNARRYPSRSVSIRLEEAASEKDEEEEKQLQQQQQQQQPIISPFHLAIGLFLSVKMTIMWTLVSAAVVLCVVRHIESSSIAGQTSSTSSIRPIKVGEQPQLLSSAQTELDEEILTNEIQQSYAKTTGSPPATHTNFCDSSHYKCSCSALQTEKRDPGQSERTQDERDDDDDDDDDHDDDDEPHPDHQHQSKTLCLSEDCVMAASTILSSLDRSVDPCEDFYQFACGGWIQKSVITNTDRFSAIDKRNQNIIHRLLRQNVSSLRSSESGEDVGDNSSSSAEIKAKKFYQACMVEGGGQDKQNLDNLQQLVAYSGGWNLSNNYNHSVGFDDRVQMLHNNLGLNVFFTWGVIEHGGSHQIAVIAGGWNDALIVEEGDREEYLKLMTMYTMLLAQASEDTVAVNLDYEGGENEPISSEGRENPQLSKDDSAYEYGYEDMSAYPLPAESKVNQSGLSLSPILSSLFQWMVQNESEIEDESTGPDQLEITETNYHDEEEPSASNNGNGSSAARSKKSAPTVAIPCSSGNCAPESNQQIVTSTTEESPSQGPLDNEGKPVDGDEDPFGNTSAAKVVSNDIFDATVETFNPIQADYQADEGQFKRDVLIRRSFGRDPLYLCEKASKELSEMNVHVTKILATTASASIFCTSSRGPLTSSSAPSSPSLAASAASATIIFGASEEESNPRQTSSSPIYSEENFSRILERNKLIEKAMMEVVRFEEALANITSKPVDSHNLVAYSIMELDQNYPFIDWQGFFKQAFAEVLPAKPDLLFQIKILHQKQERGRQVLVNYMIWRLLAAFYPDRPPDEIQRKERCLKETEDMFAPVVTAMYIRDKGVEASEQIVQQVDMMVDIMKDAFKHNLPKLSWMSAFSLSAAQEKLEHMVDLIGYPKSVLNSTWLDTFFARAEIDATDYLSNVVTQRSFSRHKEILQFFETYNRGLWNDFAHMPDIAYVNAYYNQLSNIMVVPIGMLQPPLFWVKPKSLTFGAFGIVVAHEITHAFDDEGILYDQYGTFNPLYDNKTIDEFHLASNCVRNQYSDFEVLTGVRVDGNITLGENIADHGGLKIAEIAYHEWLKSNGRSDSQLPAVDFTHEQLFYLGYALPWCAVHSDNMMRTHIVKDEHAPDKFRVLGPLANSPRFSEAWNCPIGSVMNPESKCKIW
eukprot:TCALIF_12954-PA protein Name:"Similar to ECE1 Endothelin-converting enzyme 1 (Homo sapiens)" AED:0.20 eAED:0.20 QI:0/0/0/0.71/1/1/7/0/1168